MATRSKKAAVAQESAPEAQNTAPEEGGDGRPPRHYRCLAACYHGRRLWQVGEETVTTDDMPHHFVEITKMTEGDTA